VFIHFLGAFLGMANIYTHPRSILSAVLAATIGLTALPAFANDMMVEQSTDVGIETSSPAATTTTTTEQPTYSAQPNQAPLLQTEVQVQQSPVVAQPAPQMAQPIAVQIPPKEYWILSTQKGELRDYSKRKFAAHTITITNTQPYHIEILNAQVTNVLNEQQLVAEKSKSKSRGLGFARFASAALGSAAYIPGVGGLATMGTGGIRALQAANAASSITHQISQMDNGNVAITGTYVQRFNDVVLGPNQAFTFEVVTPKKAEPDLRMVFKNLETNQILDIQETLTASN
jgi:hypothetical protein